MTECNTKTIDFSRCNGKKVQVEFNGGDITSDAGSVLLREVDKKLNLTERVAEVINDPRTPERCGLLDAYAFTHVFEFAPVELLKKIAAAFPSVK